MSETDFPSRYENREEARRQFGDDADRYASFYFAGDPPADALVEWIERNGESAKAQFERALQSGISALPGASPELMQFFERAETMPAWVDFDQIRLGALAYQRFGIFRHDRAQRLVPHQRVPLERRCQAAGIYRRASPSPSATVGRNRAVRE